MVKSKKSFPVVHLSDDVAKCSLLLAYRAYEFSLSLGSHVSFEDVAFAYLSMCGVQLVMPKDLHDSIVKGD